MARTARVKENAAGTAHYHLMSRANDKRFLCAWEVDELGYATHGRRLAKQAMAASMLYLTDQGWWPEGEGYGWKYITTFKEGRIPG